MPNKVDVSARNYTLHPPDEIEIHCSSVPEIDMQRQQVRPDGRIGFEAVGELYAAGKTPAQVATMIKLLILEGKMKQGGIGVYDNFTHYDIRGHKARW